MGKRNKEQPASKPQVSKSLAAGAGVREPTKEPTLLAVSVVLFALWFVFLLVTAVFG